MRSVLRWGVEWHSINLLDGETRELMWDDTRLLLFLTRREAREWSKQHYGYIKHRPDLRREPHGWRLPRAVRVEVSIRKLGVEEAR